MSKRAYLFAVSVCAAGAITVAAALATWSSASPVAFLLCLCLALLGATMKVQVPGISGTISPAVVPILYAAGKLTWQETAVMAALAGFVQCVWRAKRTPLKIQIMFNSANYAVSSAISFAISHRVAASAPLLAFLVAAIVFQLADTLSVATVLSLLEEKSFRGMWQNCHLWSFPYMLAGGGFAAIWGLADAPASLSVTVICAVLLYLMSTFYQEIVARTCRLT